MKKIISFVLAAAMSAMVAVPAFAAEAETVKDEGANTWTTSGQSDDFKDKMMTMVAYAPGTDGTITVDSIQYIDQTTADNTGAYSFDSYIPKNLPTEGDYAVKVGSEARNSAIDAGKIEKIESVDVAVTGAATAIGSAQVEVDFYSAGGSTSIYNADVTDNTYSVNVAPGTYDVVFSSLGYLDYKITNVEVTDAVELPAVTMLAGDIDNNNTINISDICPVVGAYLKTSGDPEFNTVYDFDADNSITVSDIGYVTTNYMKDSVEIDYSELN